MTLSKLIFAIVVLLTIVPVNAAHAVYSASHGRWLTRDPFGNLDGPSLYGYANALPQTNTDPTGGAAVRFHPCYKAGQECGGIDCGIKMSYEGPHCQKGAWFIVKLHFEGSCTACGLNNRVTGEATLWERFEAVKTPGGYVGRFGADTIHGCADTWRWSGFPSTKDGEFTAIGTLKFFCEEHMESYQQGNIWDGWNDFSPMAGTDLLTMCDGTSFDPIVTKYHRIGTTPPKWWRLGGSGGSDSRSAHSTWNCCDCPASSSFSCDP